MKYINRLFYIGILVATMVACSSTGTSNETHDEKTSKAYTSMYICPMHCAGSGSDSMGVCPVCKMDYVKNDEHSH